MTDQETIFERIARGPEPKTSAVIDHGTPGQWHGAKAQTTIACTTDDEVRFERSLPPLRVVQLTSTLRRRFSTACSRRSEVTTSRSVASWSSPMDWDVRLIYCALVYFD